MSLAVESQSAASRVRTATAVVCFALGLIAAAGAVRSAIPWPADLDWDGRLDDLFDHPGTFDTLYFGSSHVFRSFVPSVIDAELEKQNHPVRSLNLGTPGMTVFESDFLIREVLDRSEGPYRWIFFEYNFNLFQSPDRIVSTFNRFKERVVFWHTPGRVRDVVRATFDSQLPADEKAEIAWMHTLHGLWRFGSVGQGMRSMARRFDGPTGLTGTQSAPRGYQSIESSGEVDSRRKRAEFLAESDQWAENVKSIDSLNRSSVALDGIETRPLRALQDAIRASGAIPVVIVTAFPYAAPALFELERAGTIESLVAMNSPDRYPDLYRVDRRYDGLHLNERGAREFSVAFAHRFAEMIDGVR